MRNSLRDFVLVAAALFLLRLFFGFVTFPTGVAHALTLFSAVLFVGLPVYAMYRASSHEWSAKSALGFLVAGALLHVVGALLARVGRAGRGPSTSERQQDCERARPHPPRTPRHVVTPASSTATHPASAGDSLPQLPQKPSSRGE